MACAALAEADVLVGEPSILSPLVKQCPKLVWMQSTFAGCNQLLQQPRRDFVATRLAGFFGPDMAEYTALHVLTRERQLRTLWERQQDLLQPLALLPPWTAERLRSDLFPRLQPEQAFVLTAQAKTKNG